MCQEPPELLLAHFVLSRMRQLAGKSFYRTSFQLMTDGRAARGSRGGRDARFRGRGHFGSTALCVLRSVSATELSPYCIPNVSLVPAGVPIEASRLHRLYYSPSSYRNTTQKDGLTLVQMVVQAPALSGFGVGYLWCPLFYSGAAILP